MGRGSEKEEEEDWGGEDGWRCGKGKKKHRSQGESGLGWKREEGARGVLGTKWN